MFRILHNTHIDFIRRWKIAAITIAVFILPALVLIPVQGFNYSIEFTGGTLMQLEFREPPGAGAIRAALAPAGLADAEISTFGTQREFIIRAQESRQVAEQAGGAESIANRIGDALARRFDRSAFTIVRTEAVGPRIGSELRRQATIAMLLAFALTLIYLTWRFESRFAVAAVLATIHDIIATLAFMKYMNLEISVFVVGAILTVIGYSMNDKVVVFDRVRENLRKSKRESLYELLNRSVNETLPRTVMTGSTTLACLLALLIFGGSVIRPFAWVLTFGIIVGTFSSIFVASPILLWIERRWPRTLEEKARATGTGRASTAAPGSAAGPKRGGTTPPVAASGPARGR